jgi:hypothetical protein
MECSAPHAMDVMTVPWSSYLNTTASGTCAYRRAPTPVLARVTVSASLSARGAKLSPPSRELVGEPPAAPYPTSRSKRQGGLGTRCGGTRGDCWVAIFDMGTTVL